MSSKKKILVTGGAGYIGSHTCLELLNTDHETVVVDNLSNSHEESLKRVMDITGKQLSFIRADLLDMANLHKIFAENKFDAVIHFAAFKAVGESNDKPLLYYQNNLGGMLNVVEAMKKAGVSDLVFSSSATVYGVPETVPISEDFPLSATNPYGQTKLMCETMLKDIAKAHPELNIALLRYFNPIGAHESGRIGEDPQGLPNNLLPYVAQVAVGKLEQLSVYGDDYPTKDGTGVRDYIHVVDLAIGHIQALKKLETGSGLVAYNLGTGNGYSVLEIIKTFSKISGKEVPYKVVARREGDVAECFADPSLAKNELGWQAQRNLEDMCRDAWKWQSENPTGYSKS